jgi:hypothetical protein
VKPPKGASTRRTVGRPRILETPEELERRAHAYFAQCKADKEPLTVTGLALALGLSSRQSLDRYGQRPEFRYVVRWAKLVVEHDYELRLNRDRPAGAIFALKQMGWRDERSVAFQGRMTVDLDKLPDAVLQRVAVDGIAPLAALAEWAERSGEKVEPYLLPPGRGEG